MDRLRSALSDRYTIDHEIGHGGMATVYLAEDVRHGRKVAVKVLRPEFAESLGTERFLREIGIAARLSHPNILPLHDSGEADGFLYYVMPYIEGETIRDRLVSEKQLPVEDVVEITKEVSAALDYAHRQGVVHRDIKPENILIHEGKALVADFGIALAVSVAGGDRLTETGMVVGTPAYMSPEQSSGESHLDARSDIYSLATVVYEMLTGQPPFTGPTAQAIIARRLSETPPSIRVVRDGVSPGVEQVVHKALSRVPADRYKTAVEFAEELEKPSEVVVVPPKRSKRIGAAVVGVAAVVALVLGGVSLVDDGDGSEAIELDPNVVAVMPWRVSGADSSLAKWRHSAMDLLQTHLNGQVGRPLSTDPAELRGIWARLAGGEDLDLPDDSAVAVAARLGAGQMLRGSLMGTEDSLHAFAELWDVEAGEVLARDNLEGSAEDLLSLLPRLAMQVSALAGGTQFSSDTMLLNAPTEAIRLYLAGLDAFRRLGREEAIDTLWRALEVDSTFVPAAMEIFYLAGYYLSIPQHYLPALDLAWRYRDRLTEEDRLYVTVMHPGGGYHEVLERVDAALEQMPDNEGLLSRLVWLLYAGGVYRGEPDWGERALNALDRMYEKRGEADKPGLHYWWPFEVASATSDTSRTRHYAELYLGRDAPEEVHYDTDHWWVYAYLGDTTRLERMHDHPEAWCPLGGWGDGAFLYVVPRGLKLDDWRFCLDWRESAVVTTGDRQRVTRGRAFLAVIQGRPGEAIARFDSVTAHGMSWSPFHPVVMAVTEPGVEVYDQAATQFAQAHRDDPSFDPICHTELWRISQGETSRARESVRRLRAMLDSLAGSETPWAARRVCPLLLETLVAFEWGSRDSAGIKLDQLDSLMRTGPQLRSSASGPFLADLANLLIARMRYARGEYASGLAAVRRRKVNTVFTFVRFQPIVFREEGRLAAAAGDAGGAIRAYTQYLNLRPDPERGPIREEWEQVRRELAALVGEGGRR